MARVHEIDLNEVPKDIQNIRQITGHLSTR